MADNALLTMTMTASERDRRACAYAEDMMRHLEEINKRYPFPQDFTDADRKAAIEWEQNFPISHSQTPEQMKQQFIELYCAYTANHYIIIPDADPS